MLNKKDKLLAAAQKFLERGSLDKALVEFQRAAQEDAKDTRTWLRIAEIHVKRGEAPQATAVYLKTAELYVEQGFFQRAAAVYKNVLKLTPGHTEAHTKLAEVYRQLGLLSDSSQQYEQAASAFAKGGKPKEAMGALAQILEMNPDQVMVRVKMAEVAAQAGLTEDAVREFVKAAEQLESQGRTDDFLRVTERLLQLQPDNIAFGKKAAVRYMERQNPKAALAKLQACFNIDAKDTETLQLLANAFSELGQTAKTVTVLKELAKVQEERRQLGERAATLQRIRTLDPTDPIVADLDQPRSKRPPALDEDAPAPVVALPPSIADRRLTPVRREPTITFSELAVPPILAREPSQTVFTAGDTALPSLDEEQINAEVARVLAETDTFVKYGLVERAAEHVRRVFDLVPEHQQAQERLIAILIQLGRRAEAVEELGVLADKHSVSDPPAAIALLERALELDPTAVGARHMLERLTGGARPAAGKRSEDDAEILELDELEDIDDELEPMADLPTSAIAAMPATLATPAPARPGAAVELDLGDPGVVVAESAVTPSPAPIVDDDDASSEWDTGGQTQIDPRALGASFTAPAEPEAPPLLDELEIEFDLPVPAAKAPAPGSFVRPPAAAAPVAKPAPAPSPRPAVAAKVALPLELDPVIEAELEQVDFFLMQGLWDDARAIMGEFPSKYMAHPAVAERRARLEAATAAGQELAEPTRMQSSEHFDHLLGGDAGAVPRGTHSADSARTPVREPSITPRAVVAAGVDPATQRDLGIAYKEMGLKDAAIAEFSKLTEDPDHQVFALMMIGECYEDEGAFAEALLHYKKALNRPGVREDEALRLYFLLGRAFEALGDQGEALYFFEKVARRDQGFEDVAARVERLRRSGVAPVDRGNHEGGGDRRRAGQR